MKTETNLTRREALLSAIKGAVATSLVVPLMTEAAEPAAPPEPEFVPENDYPFFGHEPDPLA